jgi:hypothetical protein
LQAIVFHDLAEHLDALNAHLPALGLFFAVAISPPVHAAGSSIVVAGAWARDSAGPTGAVYLTLRNEGPAGDRLVGVATEAAKTAELHQSREENGIMKMRPVAGFDLPAHGSVSLAPGGYHIMPIGLARPVKAGGAISVTLRFAKAEPMTLQVPIKDMAGADMNHGSMSGVDMGHMEHAGQ